MDRPTQASRTEPLTPGLAPLAILLVALSLSIGWGVRGNWGHEYGAMIPGALAALAACLVSGREDWRRRFPYFAFFGALGWSFGGSISYMIVIGYTHSGHPPSILYGFASLFVIGFLWGAIGGAGTALPAVLDRRRLTEFFLPILVVIAAWQVQEALAGAAYRRGWGDRLDWYDTDWMAAATAIVAVGALAAFRGRWDWGSSLILHLAVGWWVGFLALVVVLGLRMTPPRSDNWAGVLGMTAAMMIFFLRQGLWPLLHASLVAGVAGGLGFSAMQAMKLMGIAATDAYPTNWHSLLEQSYGFVNGVGIAFALGFLARRVPAVNDEPTADRWTGPFSVGFILLVLTFINIRKNIRAVWLPNRALPETLHGVGIESWFNAAYLLVALVVVGLIVANVRRPLAILPATALGRGQLFYLVFLWWIVLGNLSRYFPFAEQRLVTEGVIHGTSLAATLLALTLPGPSAALAGTVAVDWRRTTRGFVATSLAMALAAVAVEFALTRTFFDERFSGDDARRFAGRHIRFGPEATAPKPE